MKVVVEGALTRPNLKEALTAINDKVEQFFGHKEYKITKVSAFDVTNEVTDHTMSGPQYFASGQPEYNIIWEAEEL